MILGAFKWCDGGKYTVIQTTGQRPSGAEIARWLFSLSYDDFCDALQDMVDSGEMTLERAMVVYDKYAATRTP